MSSQEKDERYKILAVDDEPTLLEMNIELLTSRGYLVESAPNGAVALTMIEAGTYDAIISDYLMPEVNGLELLEILRMTGVNTPFIMTTAYGERERMMIALRLGATDFIDKPFEASVLLKSVARAAQLGRLEKLLKQEIAKVSGDHGAERLGEIDAQLSEIKRRVAG